MDMKDLSEQVALIERLLCEELAYYHEETGVKPDIIYLGANQWMALIVSLQSRGAHLIPGKPVECYGVEVMEVRKRDYVSVGVCNGHCGSRSPYGRYNQV